MQRTRHSSVALVSMIIRRVIYFLSQAIRNLKESPLPSLVSIATITITLFILGAFLIIIGSLSGVLDQLGQTIQVIAYAQKDIPHDKLEAIRTQLKAFGEIEDVHSISPEEALRRLKKNLEGQEGILEGLERNPLPPSFEIEIKKSYRTPQAVRLIARRLSKIPGIDDVSFGQTWVERFNSLLGIIHLFSTAIMAFLILAVTIIVANTIKLTVYARGDEIEVMRLVGATDSFIKAPFVLEGMIQGLAGAALSLLMLFIMYQVLTARIDAAWVSSLWGVRIAFLSPSAMMGILVGGMCLGTFGTFMSLWRFLQS